MPASLHLIVFSFGLDLFSIPLARAAAPAGEPVKIGFFLAFTDREASFDPAHLTSPR